MDPISNVDHLVLLLRQRLLERSKAAAGRTKAKTPTSRTRRASAIQALTGADDRQLGRAVIRNVLTEHFGVALINDAQFQQMVDKVAETMEREPSAAKLLTSLVRQLRAEGS